MQTGEEEIVLNRVMSVSVDFPDKEFEMIELTGAWSRERAVKIRKLEHGTQSVYSMRGCSSHHYNPFLALKRRETQRGMEKCMGSASFTVGISWRRQMWILMIQQELRWESTRIPFPGR